MYKVGDIFYFNSEYSKRAQWCNENNKVIVEIDADKENGQRRFQIQEPPAPTSKDLAIQKIYQLKEELKKWKEDVEQVELFGMTRTDYDEKKTRCVEIIEELRELEQEVRNG